MRRCSSSVVIALIALSVFSSVITSSAGRRRYKAPSSFGYPSQFGQQQENYGGFGQQQENYGGFGQHQTQFPSYPGHMEFGGLQQQVSQNDDYEGVIQQVSTDDEEGYLTLIQQAQPSKNAIPGSPPKYTQSTTTTEPESEVVPTTQQVLTERPEAVTPKGTFVGKRENVNGKDVYAFYGIPYAKPPTGELRFKRPLPADKLEEPLDTITLPDACPQTLVEAFPGFQGEQMWNANTNMSENCLFLNIWIPAPIFEEKEQKQVPVLYWIYGGGFFSGSISLDVYNGATLAATEGIIVVNVQYRLGPLGFLYFGIDEAPGNMGLLDQALGLKWTRENIEYFGGNPNSITLAGESCGSASVGYHLVSPISRNFFKRAMMTSGLPTVKYAFKPPETLKKRSYLLAKHAGCNQKNCKEIMECLRQVDSQTLSSLQWKLYKDMLDFPFSPTIDGYFLPDLPANLVKKGKAKRAELIMGTVRDEGSFFVIYHYVNYLSHLKPTDITYDRFVEIMEELFHEYSESQREAIINQYTNWENPEDGYTNQKLIVDAVGDALFVCPHREFADAWSNRGLPVYYYHFTERSKMNPWGEWLGVLHGDDIPLLFGEALRNPAYPDSEKEMTLNFMNMVGDFARKGVPSQEWERYTSEHPVYLDVNATTVTSKSAAELHGPRASQCAFWNKLIPSLQTTEEKCKSESNSMEHPKSQYEMQPQNQFNQNERPQWNTQGQGIHGGRDFITNDMLRMQNQQSSYCSQPQFQVPPTSPSYQKQQQPQQFGQGSSSNLQPFSCEDKSSNTVENENIPDPSTSCKCTVSERQETQQPEPTTTSQSETEYLNTTPSPARY